MIFKFLSEYNNWKREHKREVQEAQLRKDIMKLPLNYNTLDMMFKVWTENRNQDAVMEITTNEFKIKCYYDDKGQYQRLTTTEKILQGEL